MAADYSKMSSFHDFTARDLNGSDVSMSKYKGHPTLIVNIATECGLGKDQYRELNELMDKYARDGLRIAAFPCDQFLNETPGDAQDIKKFVKENDIKFDVYDKVDVNGKDASQLWQWLKSQQSGFLGTEIIKWNFTKFLVDADGHPVNRYAPTTAPTSIEPDLQKTLRICPQACPQACH